MGKKLGFLISLCLFQQISFGQQNFFNVPSSDITEEKKSFFQQQFNIYEGTLVSNSTFDIGLGHGLEFGVNGLGLTYDEKERRFVENAPDEKPIYPSLGFNSQKMLFQRGAYALTLGGQLLFSVKKPIEAEYYFYLNNKVQIKNTKIVGGLFYGNNNYFGEETRLTKSIEPIGIQLGMEYQILPEKLSFQADYISGRTELSNLIVGAAYKLTKQWILSAGYQIPDDNKTSPNGVIFELTFIQ